MGTKPDFAQKLLHDLRLRKERMAAAQTSDKYRNSRQNFKGSRGTRTPEAAGPKIESRYRKSSDSQKSPAAVQSANQIVSYGGGNHSGQVVDLSMALSYAFDNRGQLKRLDIASNGAMINLLQHIGKRSMQQCLDIQWQSTNQFPILTHLHVDEISKGAQKLNQILRACSIGMNNSDGSIEIGKELWKGAMELEQSLRMLVSLQEASDNTISPQRKNRFKLIDEHGDSEDDSTVSSRKQKQVERPVFSFDRPSKNTKASVQTAMQQKLTALPDPEDTTSKPERPISMTSESIPHRRSASCGPDFQISQLTDCSKSKHNAARLPNVIAKLMGLEELPQNINSKVATESPFPQQKSIELVSIHTAQRRSKSAELKTELAKTSKNHVNQNKLQSNKITILTTHKKELQEDTYRSTNNHGTMPNLENPRWNEEERQGVKNYVKESKAAMFKINELQKTILHLNQDKCIRKETKVITMNQKQGEVPHATKTLQQMVTPDNRSLLAVKARPDTLGNLNTHETQKMTARKPLLTQRKQNRDIKLQPVNVPYEPQHNKLKAENGNRQRANPSEPRKRERNLGNLRSTRIVARDLKNYKKHLPTKQADDGKKIVEDIGSDTSKAVLSNRQDEDPVREGRSMNPDDKWESSLSSKPNENDPSTHVLTDTHMEEVCSNSKTDTKETHDSTKKVVSNMKATNLRPTMLTDEEITETHTTPRRIARPLKPQRPTPHRLEQNEQATANITSAAAEANESIRQSAEKTPGNHESGNLPIFEKSRQDIDAEQIKTKKNRVRDEPSQNSEEATQLPLGDGGENTLSTISDDQQEQLVPDEVEVTLHITAKDDQEDLKNNICDQHQEQQMPKETKKRVPLTEDELFLKQKLIISQLFLNTAEALFKLNIPISILNYASDQIYEEKDSKILLDCAYELLKRKGRREIYPSINILMTSSNVRSLDDLVRHLHKDFEALRSYGRNRRNEHDYMSCILKMLESDIYNRYPNINCMWDYGWNEMMFPYAKKDEVISNIEQLMLDELMYELVDSL